MFWVVLLKKKKVNTTTVFQKFLDDLLTSNQSGFRPRDSCVHQLLSKAHEIYKAFDANPSLDVRAIILDLPKAFDRVWHDGLMYKLKSLGICGNYYGLIHSFLSDIKEWFSTVNPLNGHTLRLEFLRAQFWDRYSF